MSKHRDQATLLDHLNRPSSRWAFITAENPGACHAGALDNAARMYELERWLQDHGCCSYVRCCGKFAGTCESSLLVWGVTEAEAAALAVRFDQACVAVRSGLVWVRDVELCPCETKRAGDVTPATGALRAAPQATDNYTDIPLDDGTVCRVVLPL